jgi:flagellar FliL protein
MLAGGGSGDGAEAEAGGGGDGHGGASGPVGQVRLDNVIVNPSGSQGTRYVVASVVFDVGDEELAASMKASEIALRDAIGSTIERYTVAELTRAGGRDSLRVRLAEAAEPFLHGGHATVYLPQFLIQ